MSDAAARLHAVDPSQNVVLEASAGTGKTRVLVERYVNLLRAGVDPDHILAITFTRKAAAEMRERIIERLREASRQSEFDRGRWRELKDRLADIAISTIDAFCLSLLRDSPLEADIDPGFELADDTEVPRLIAESLDQALRICRFIAKDDDDVALVFAQLGERRLRTGLDALLGRRLVAPDALRRYLAKGPRGLTAAIVCHQTADRLRRALADAPCGLQALLADGPVHHRQFAMLADDLRALISDADRTSFESRESQAALRALIDRVRGYFLTQEGRPRGERFAGTGFTAADCRSDDAWKRHRVSASAIAPVIAETIRAFRRDLNVVMARGVWRIFAVTLSQYQRTLETRALLDFSGVLERAVRLLKGMDEFAQSRFRLEAKYRHVLVDEFQDTSRAQWELVAQLVRTWGEGAGASSDAMAPSIFIVGDRKQSIYGFRDADVSVLDEAAGFISGLRGDGDPRHAIAVSFRAVPQLLEFVNAVCGAIEKFADRRDAFRYDESDRFPLGQEGLDGREGQERQEGQERREGRNLLLPLEPDEPADSSAVGIIVGDSVTETADRVAEEIVRLLKGVTIRDRKTGVRRAARPADVAILFRSRDTHREFEKALERRSIATYVFKGLGFFEADEVQDAVALLRYLADPYSEIRTAAFLRSRLVRLSDPAIATLARNLSNAVLAVQDPAAIGSWSEEDRGVITRLRRAVPVWLSWVDRLTPSDLLRRVLAETAYVQEIQGPRRQQARENLKKLGAMVRRFQNRGYATLSRVADHLEQLAVGDESNAVVDAEDAVSLMTVHAAKGLEFPIVFIVNMNRGTGTGRAPIRVAADARGEAAVAIADYQSEADEDSAAKDREETKRLLYVALTRARDRLYLSASVATGVIRPTKGSLGEVLPGFVRDFFARASSAADGRHLLSRSSLDLSPSPTLAGLRTKD
ncbi:MAG TPA: UvrD-helicase domain-containing protein [Vicinamibacterales bacterium]